jgi:hypothetical protein
MPRNRLWCLVCSLCVSLTVGCPGRDEGLAVTVQTDFVPVVEFDTIVTTLDDADARDVGVAPSDSFVGPGQSPPSRPPRRGGARCASSCCRPVAPSSRAR